MYRVITVITILSVMVGCKGDVVDTTQRKSEMPPLNQFVKVEKTASNQRIITVADSTAKAEATLKKTNTASPPEKKQQVKSTLSKQTQTPPVTKQKVTRKKKKKRKVQKPQKREVTKSSLAKVRWQESIHDFGEIVEGDVINHSFKFTNTGNVPLEIKEAKASCGCTRPSFPFILIPPGESNQIGVTYHSVGKDGDQVAEVTVIANTEPKVTVLKLRGHVKPKPEKEITEEAATDSTAQKKSGKKSPIIKAINQAVARDTAR